MAQASQAKTNTTVIRRPLQQWQIYQLEEIKFKLNEPGACFMPSEVKFLVDLVSGLRNQTPSQGTNTKGVTTI